MLRLRFQSTCYVSQGKPVICHRICLLKLGFRWSFLRGSRFTTLFSIINPLPHVRQVLCQHNRRGSRVVNQLTGAIGAGNPVLVDYEFDCTSHLSGLAKSLLA